MKPGFISIFSPLTPALSMNLPFVAADVRRLNHFGQKEIRASSRRVQPHPGPGVLPSFGVLD
jgi:hypothetical protein